MKSSKRNKTAGITLIALVVTIIVLLLLAGISIQMITGNNGILNRTIVAKQATEEVQIIEEARRDILAKMSTSKSGDITEAELEEILSKYGTVSSTGTLTSTDGQYQIPVAKIYNGDIYIQTIADADEKVYYGQPIDYDVDLGKYTDIDADEPTELDIDLDGKPQYDWKIFYYDKDNGNIYIIAEDYVPMENSLMPTIPGRNERSSYSYCLDWPYNGETVQNGKTGSADIFGTGAPSKTLSFANKFLADWKPKVTGTNSASTYSNARVTATLLDTDLWSYNSSTGKGFTNSAKIQSLNSNYMNEFFAVGGPTLEMWVKSWNKKHGSESDDINKLQLYYTSNATGYNVGTSENPGCYVYQEGTTGYTDTLYYPHTSAVGRCGGYWLASPSSWSSGCLAVVYCEQLWEGGTVGAFEDLRLLLR